MQVSLIRPDDWHLHLRDGEMLKAVIASSAKDFGRALIMPNLVPPVVTSADAKAYRQRIIEALHCSESYREKDGKAHPIFEPMMTLYLTETTDARDVVSAAEQGVILAVKLYPAGATTNSASGVRDIDKVMPVLEAMAANGIVLCIHGEVTDASVDIFDREARFIDTVLDPLRRRLPELRVVMEHITTSGAVSYVEASTANLAATITPHHLMINRNHMLTGGIRPHYYCLPIVKRATHQQALIDAACSADSRYFLGTDSAPHPRHAKLSECGCAGVFNAANALACLATVFERAGALDNLERFVSINGAKWYGLETSQERITLERVSSEVPLPEPIVVGDDVVIPFDPACALHWQVV
ncbi:MAG: dihydroorotase [Granulosicoccus sp.]|nr:dihydroorotase [Granulosicoccus sp.]